LTKDLQRLCFDINRRIPNPEFPAAFVEVAVAKPPDVTGIRAIFSSRLVDHCLALSSEFLESSVRTRKAAVMQIRFSNQPQSSEGDIFPHVTP
jgi:hypothetical protein